MNQHTGLKTANALAEFQFDDLRALAENGDIIAYFGYGSLVNIHTLRTKIVHYERAQLQGFARTWQARPDEADLPIALLSSAPSMPDDVLDGLLVFDRAENLASLDEREAGYDRLTLDESQLILANGGSLPNCPLYVYSGRAPHKPDAPHYILQSYLDAVLQGYLHQYGEDGARAFMARTAAFDTPILTDRDTPHYPRSVALEDHERVLIDNLTSGLNRVASF